MLEHTIVDGKKAYKDTVTGEVTMDQSEAEETTDQESVLDSLLKKVDLNAPLEVPLGDGRLLEISKEQFIQYYLPRNATQEEAFHCFNQTRMAGLSPLVAGECHYPRFSADQPLRLYTGYPVYLRKAYENGLTHLECEFEVAENGLPVSVKTTLEIKGREKPVIWQTWFAEVVGMTKGGVNWRWKKAPFSQLRKCGVVDAIRYSGLLSHMNLPLVIEEMPEAVAEGHRTLTQEQLDAHAEGKGEASIGKVDAATHQIDMSAFRHKYFGMLKETGGMEDERRRDFQEETTGKRHLSDYDVEDYSKLFEAVVAHKIHLGMSSMGTIPQPEPSQPEEEQGEQEDPPETKDGTPVEDAVKDAVDHGVQETADALVVAYREYCQMVQAVFGIDGEKAIEWERAEFGKTYEKFDLDDLRTATVQLQEIISRHSEDPRYHSGLDQNIGAQTAEEQTAEKVDRLEAEAAQRDNEAVVKAQTRPEEPQGSTAPISLAVFVELAKTKFASDIVRDDWIGTITEKPMDQWSVSEIAIATQALSELADLPGAHVPAKESTQQDEDERKRLELKGEFLKLVSERFSNPTELMAWIEANVGPAHPDKMKLWDSNLFIKGIKLLSADDGDEKMTTKTRDALRDALETFPEQKYKSMRTQQFRKFANGAIEGDFLTVGDLTEKDGQLIVWKLAAEKAAIEEKIEQTKANLLDEDETGEQEQADGATFIDDKLKEAAETGEITDDDPLNQGSETSINPDQFAEMKALVNDMPERFHKSIGSEAFTDFTTDVVGHRVYGMLTLSHEKASDIIHAMKDMITDEAAALAEIKRKSAERKPVVA